MEKSKGGLGTALSAKEDEDETPVSACREWVDACEFCDKRFNSWEEVSDELLDKIPPQPGIYQIALKEKGLFNRTTEVVLIVLDKTDIQKPAYNSIDRIKDKNFKAANTAILCRWRTFKNPDDEEVVNMCAHWHNNGVLPKQMVAWPGMDILQKTDSLVFSDKLQKWCYPKRNSFLKNAEFPQFKQVEVIEACNWNKPCEICDANFSNWMKVDDANYLAPNELGIFMLGAFIGEEVEVVDICYDWQGISINIKDALELFEISFRHVLRNKKFVNKHPTLKVRWMLFTNAESDNCCYLYAHWFNVGSKPMMTYEIPGDEILEKNKSFVFRNYDKKWCCEIDALKHMNIRKSKNEKHVLD